ncbi:MAG: hypothetical protein H7249_07665, partial [Chitinophagaceae bacterium]|nr:hypothetical protein [Oligoflexus sp.]
MSEAENKFFTDQSPLSHGEEGQRSSEIFVPSPISSFDEDDTRATEQHLSFSCPVDHSGAAVHVQGWAGIHSEFPPVILVHDLGENSDFYAPAARILADRGFQAYCY